MSGKTTTRKSAYSGHRIFARSATLDAIAGRRFALVGGCGAREVDHIEILSIIQPRQRIIHWVQFWLNHLKIERG